MASGMMVQCFYLLSTNYINNLGLQVNFIVIFTNLLTELAKLSVDEIKKLNVDLSGVTFMTGGCVYNAVNTNEVLSKTGLKALIQAYGSTEAGGIATLDDEDNFVPGSAGMILPNYQMKVINNTISKHINCKIFHYG